MARSQALRDRGQRLAKKHELALQDELKKIFAQCGPVCLKAAEEYNTSSARFFIVPESIGQSINLKDKTLSLLVKLKDARGNEPDEEFGWEDEDEKAINATFGKILDKHLLLESIPFTFGAFSFPSWYYAK